MAKNANELTSVLVKAPNRNRFDLSYDHKLSCNMGEMIPVYATEAVPGDKFSISCEALMRFAPMLAPIMHRVDVSVHYFFVPYRILWGEWESWICDYATDNTPPAFPFLQIESDGSNYTRQLDYLGIPDPVTDVVATASYERISAMFSAAYAQIWNDYYRDQNLQAPIVKDQGYLLVNGDNSADPTQHERLTTLRRRAWEHDYFTSCLPFAQKGSPVSLPIGPFEDVVVARSVAGGGFTGFTPAGVPPSPAGPVIVPNAESTVVGGDQLYAQTSALNSTQTTINDLRKAMRLQEFLEKDARGGTRYNEKIYAHFGVKSSDSRLQRPEYITGVKSPVTISEVLQTGSSDDTSPQGNMAGHGVSVVSGQYGDYFCEEHGVIMGIMTVMPKPAYQQGIPRMFTKINDPYEYYWPEFAHIGEQQVQNRELYAYQLDGDDTFGYIPRYADYRFPFNRVSGDFKSSLDFWHMGRIFDNAPALNSQFIVCDPTHRIFAVEDPDVQKLWCHLYNKVSGSRLMPVFGTPTL